MQGVLPTPSAETGGAHTEGRPTVGEQDSQVRALELQIDALYGVPPNNGAPGVPFRAVQQAGVCAFIQVDFMEVVPGGWFMFMDVLQ